MDKTDLRVVEALKEDSRASIKEISKKTGVPITTVYYRLKNMEKRKALKFTARADRTFLDKELVAYVIVKVMPGVDHDKMMEKIISRPEVEEGAIITGEFDLIFKASVKNMDELNDFVLKYLRANKEVAETRTMISYKITEK